MKKQNRIIKPLLIGVTGSFGAGKSLVGAIFHNKGAYVVDTDCIVRDILKTRNIVTEKLVKYFGESIIFKQDLRKARRVCTHSLLSRPKGHTSLRAHTTAHLFCVSPTKHTKEFINRNALANIVFKNKVKRNLLESIIHPAVKEHLKQIIIKKHKEKLIVVLAPLLFEAKMEKLFDVTLCVVCSEKKQLSRLRKKGYSLKEAKARIKSQFSQFEKSKRADFIINNSFNVNHTKKQVDSSMKKILTTYSTGSIKP